jgi:Fe2+ or Zn2+ uptake regulation protein
MLIDTKADSLGFKANQLTIEIKGLCHSCQGA